MRAVEWVPCRCGAARRRLRRSRAAFHPAILLRVQGAVLQAFHASRAGWRAVHVHLAINSLLQERGVCGHRLAWVTGVLWQTSVEVLREVDATYAQHRNWYVDPDPWSVLVRAPEDEVDLAVSVGLVRLHWLRSRARTI